MSLVFFNTTNNITKINGNLIFQTPIKTPFLLVLYSKECPACQKLRSSIYNINEILSRSVLFNMNISMISVDKHPKIVEKLYEVGIHITYVPVFLWIRDGICRGIIKVENIYKNPQSIIREIVDLDNYAFGENSIDNVEKYTIQDIFPKENVEKKKRKNIYRYKTADSVAQVTKPPNISWS
jgi:hypothetical protein